MIDPEKLNKRYYKIGEVSSLFNVASSLIRYWEKEFPQLKPMKGKSGIRRYQKEDILILDRIYELVKVQGFKLDGAKKVLAQTNSNSTSGSKLHLRQAKNELLELRKKLVKLQTKIKEASD